LVFAHNFNKLIQKLTQKYNNSKISFVLYLVTLKEWLKKFFNFNCCKKGIIVVEEKMNWSIHGQTLANRTTPGPSFQP